MFWLAINYAVYSLSAEYCYITNSQFADLSGIAGLFLWRLWEWGIFLQLHSLQIIVKTFTDSSSSSYHVLCCGSINNIIIKKSDSWSLLFHFKTDSLGGFPPSVSYCPEPYSCSRHGNMLILSWYCGVALFVVYLYTGTPKVNANYRLRCQSKIHPYLLQPPNFASIGFV